MVISNIFVYKIVLDIWIFFHCRKGLWTFVVIKELLMKKKNSWKIKSLWCSMIKLYFQFFFIKNLFSLMWALVWLLSFFFNISPICKQILCDGGRWKYLSLVEVRAGILSVMRSHRFSPESFPLSPLLYTLVHLYCCVDLLLEAIHYPVKRSK